MEEALGIPVVCALPWVTDMHLRMADGSDGLRLQAITGAACKAAFSMRAYATCGVT